MDTLIPPEPHSRWENIKKGTIYRVWMTATDVDSPDRPEFVIYQLVTFPILEADIFTVCHSETAKIGKVCNVPFSGDQWFIHWRDGVQVGPIAWARPLNIWHEKFNLIGS